MAVPPSSGDLRKLPNPPKFGGAGGGQVSWPQNLTEAVSFTRWLVSLWRVASEASTLPETIAAARTPGRQGSDQETLSAAQALSFRPNRLPQDPGEVLAQIVARAQRPPGEIDLGQVRAKQDHRPHELRGDELNALTSFAVSRVPYPFRVPTDGAKCLLGPHPILGTLTTDGTTGNVVWASGDKFIPEMEGRIFSMAGFAQFTVTNYVDPDHVTVSPIPATPSTFVFYFDEFPSTDYLDGQFRWYTDWTTIYVDAPAFGTVDVAGDTVSWISGYFFNPYWAGKQITIDGVVYSILRNTTDPVTPTSFKIDGTVTASGVDYSIDAGVWEYSAGQYTGALADIPAAVGLQDTGLLYFAADYEHSYQFDGADWDYAPGDPGSNYLVAGSLGDAPDGGKWGLCNGSSYTRSKSDGTTTSVVTRDLTNGDVIRAGDAGHDPGTSPTFAVGAKTDQATSLFAFGAETALEAAHTHDVTVPLDVTQPGVTGTFNFGDPGTFTSTPGTPHSHSMSNTDAPQLPHVHDLGSDAVINPDGFPPNTGVNWYVRL